MKRRLEDVEKRFRRWEDVFETGKLDMDFDTEGVSQLQSQRTELRGTLAKIVPLRSHPPRLYTEARIRRFQQPLRELFLAEEFQA